MQKLLITISIQVLFIVYKHTKTRAVCCDIAIINWKSQKKSRFILFPYTNELHKRHQFMGINKLFWTSIHTMQKLLITFSIQVLFIVYKHTKTRGVCCDIAIINWKSQKKSRFIFFPYTNELHKRHQFIGINKLFWTSIHTIKLQLPILWYLFQ